MAAASAAIVEGESSTRGAEDRPGARSLPQEEARYPRLPAQLLRSLVEAGVSCR